MRRLLLLLPLVLMAGCHGDDDGIDHAAVGSAQAPLVAAAKRTGGDWSKLTPDEQKLFLERARGNEQSAKMMLGMFANKPSQGPPKH